MGGSEIVGFYENETISTSSTVRDAIKAISASKIQLALVTGDSGNVVGIVTDGDVRRGMLAGVALESPVSVVMNSNFYSATRDFSRQEVQNEMLLRGIKHVPILSEDGKLVNVVVQSDTGQDDFAQTTIVLMAGGKGKRLYPLTAELPKPMLPIGDQPILGIILGKIRAQGFKRVVISINYLGELIQEFVGDGSRFGLEVTYIKETQPLGTAGSLSTLRVDSTETIIVMNSDLITEVNFRELVTFHEENSAIATICVREFVTQVPFGVVSVDGPRVKAIDEKPAIRSLVSAGIYALNPKILDTVPENEYLDMPDLLSEMICSGFNVVAFPIHESWLDVGRPEDLHLARSEAESRETS